MSEVMHGHEFYIWFDREVTRCTKVWSIDDASDWGTEPYVFEDTAEEAATVWDENTNPHGFEGVAGQPWRETQPRLVEGIWMVKVQGVVEMFVHIDEAMLFVGPFDSIEEAQEALRNYQP